MSYSDIVTAFFMYSAHCLVSPLPSNTRPEVEHEKTLNALKTINHNLNLKSIEKNQRLISIS
jgi:hypothetical protein